MDKDDWRYSTRLTAASDVPDLKAICGQITGALGFQHYLYAVRVPVRLTEPYHFSLSGYPRAWRERYDRQGYLRIDPIVHHALTSSIPVVWDDIPRKTPLIAGFFDEAASFGLVHGISAPICGGHGERALLSVARGTDQPVSQNPGERHRLCARLHWFATVLHEAVRRVVLTREGLPRTSAPLTEREKACLMWAADGKTSLQIAQLLSIAERTVLFHLESAGRKLGVSGRHNIISRAVTLGEIELHQQVLRSLGELPVIHE